MVDAIGLGVWALLADAAFLVLILVILKRPKSAPPPAPFQLYISDLLLASVGLAPTLAIFAYLHQSHEHYYMALPWLVLMLPHQVGGMLLMVLSVLRQNVPRSAMDIVAGTLVGLVMPLLTLSIAVGCMIVITLAYLTLPVSLALMIPAIVFLAKRVRARNEA